MIPRTFLSTYASNGQQQMAVVFLTDITGLKRWADYIPVKLAQGGSENSYANNGYVDVVAVVKTSTMRPFAEYVPVYVDNSASDAWQVNATGYIPYGFAGFGDASMVLDFTNGAALDSRVTFTRASTATRTNASGIIESVSTNTARFDYNPTTLAPLGLLIEESRTNLLTYSEQFDNAAWTKTAASITANTIVAPDGTLIGDKLVEDTANTAHNINRSQGVTIGASYAFTVYAKAAERSFFRLQSFNATGDAENAVFDLATGTIFSQSGTSASTITPVGNGWYRCSVIVINDTDTSATLSIQLFSDGTTSSYTGNGYSGIYIWGAQLEAGAFATSYIPTVASQVTRAADSAVMTGTNFSSWYNQSEGSIFVSSDYSLVVGGNYRFDVTDGTSSNQMRLRSAPTGSTQSRFELTTSGVAQTTLSSATTNPVFNKDAIAYKLDDAAAVVNAGTVTVDTSLTPATMNQMAIGATRLGASLINGHIRQIAYYPRRLTNAELQGITA